MREAPAQCRAVVNPTKFLGREDMEGFAEARREHRRLPLRNLRSLTRLSIGMRALRYVNEREA
jgi:hypothetical protein